MKTTTPVFEPDHVALHIAHAALAMAVAQYGSGKAPLAHMMAQVCVLVAEGDLPGAIALLTAASKETP